MTEIDVLNCDRYNENSSLKFITCNNSSSLNGGNHNCDGFWISDLNYRSFYDYFSLFFLVLVPIETIARKRRTTLINVRAKRGAGVVSDHLLLGTFKGKFRARCDSSARPHRKYLSAVRQQRCSTAP